MKRTTSLVRLSLLAGLSGLICACGAVQTPTSMHILNADAQAAPTGDLSAAAKAPEATPADKAKGSETDKPLSESEAKLYAKGFNAGFVDAVRAQQFRQRPKNGQTTITSIRYQSTPSSTSCASPSSGQPPCIPGQAPAQSGTLLIADELKTDK